MIDMQLCGGNLGQIFLLIDLVSFLKGSVILSFVKKNIGLSNTIVDFFFH